MAICWILTPLFGFLKTIPHCPLLLKEFPLIHRDPFDRLLIATALAEQVTLITVDENIAKYDIPLIW